MDGGTLNRKMKDNELESIELNENKNSDVEKVTQRLDKAAFIELVKETKSEK